MFPRLARRVGRAIQHRDLCLWHIHQSRFVQKGWNAGQVPERTLPGRKVIHRKHGVRLAATEGRLQLNHRFPTLPVQAQGHLRQKPTHPLRNEGPLVKGLRIAVFHRRLAGSHRRQVGRKFRLLERAVQHVHVGHDDFSPGFQAHDVWIREWWWQSMGGQPCCVVQRRGDERR